MLVALTFCRQSKGFANLTSKLRQPTKIQRTKLLLKKNKKTNESVCFWHRASELKNQMSLHYHIVH
jgi:hypothetical protein